MMIVLSVSWTINAASLTLSWKVPQNTDIAGYYLDMWSDSGCGLGMNIGAVSTYTIETLLEGRTYTITIVPYDKDKNFGEPSKPIVYKVPFAQKNNNLPKPKIVIKNLPAPELNAQP